MQAAIQNTSDQQQTEWKVLKVEYEKDLRELAVY